ncbi:MAG: hypothetical protein U5Q44_11430 [Dehalococcoidia bacterium]|nr:hypothetical protein [Dehalococcoidia bacterium]
MDRTCPHINSGSATLPHHLEMRLGSVAVLDIAPGHVRAEIIRLGETPGKRNPVTPSHIELIDGQIASASWNGEVLPVGQEAE